MNITIAHHIALPITKYGGIERRIFWHMKELCKRGHKVNFIGPAGSNVTGIGAKFIEWNRAEKAWQELVPDNTDVINLFWTDKIGLDIPYVINIGGNGQPGEEFDQNTIFVSKSHARNHGCESFVNNALDIDEYPFDPKTVKKTIKNFLFLAKASWRVKNLKHCIRLSRRMGNHLHICGGRSLLHTLHPRIHNQGMVGGTKKLDIIRRCDALLFPVRWHEPFGLAIIEAMTQGLPVFGSSYGSLPDLIVEGTGRTFSSYREMEEYFLKGAESFDPQLIRDYAAKNFSIERFTTEFEERYQRVLSGERLSSTAPQWIYEQRATEPLAF